MNHRIEYHSKRVGSLILKRCRYTARPFAVVRLISGGF